MESTQPADHRALDEQDEDPLTVQRYAILERIGTGAMGVVYAAYDPELDRKVALKLLRRGSGPSHECRMLREARAMAQLSHPNVVVIHEVGTFRGRIFLAMALQSGGTLREWTRAEHRDWREILAAYLQAGRGLAAAHEAGLVHRDFKPDNCLVDRHGNVRVGDFGLVKVRSEAEPASDPSAVVATPGLELTAAGELLGTPAYMSSEQHNGKPADAASDQFAYCVSLFEALYGRRPFSGKSTAELRLRVYEGHIEEPTDDRGVPGRVLAILRRGLSAKPDDRWPTMDALLAALAHDPARARRRVATVAAFGALVGATAWFAGSRRPDPCTAAGDPVVAVWGDAARERVRTAFRRTTVPYADDAWTTTSQSLDEFAGDWARLRTEACERHRDGTQSSELFDLRMACLDHRLVELEALVGGLEAVERDNVDKVVDAAFALPSLGRCSDAAMLRATVASPSPELAEAVDDARRALADIAALVRLARFETAREKLRALEEAGLPSYAPVAAELAYWGGLLDQKTGALEVAKTQLSSAYWTALAAGADEIAARAATALVGVTGGSTAEPELGLRWARDAQALIERGGLGTEPQVSLAAALGVLHQNRDNLAEAQAQHERALLLCGSIDDDPPWCARALNNLATVVYLRGDPGGALEGFRNAQRMHERLVGADHPLVADTRANIGAMLLELGRPEQAEPELERALQIREHALGSTHPRVAVALNNLGNVAVELGDTATAKSRYERALAINSERYGDQHPTTLQTLGNLATILAGDGELERAAEMLTRVRDAARQRWGPDHVDVGIASENLGRIERNAGDLDAAERHYREALRIYEAERPDHPLVAKAAQGLGETLIDRRPAEAVTLLERAVAILEDGPPADRAEVRFALARALLAAGDPDRARAAAISARASYEAGTTRDAIDEWLAAHGETLATP